MFFFFIIIKKEDKTFKTILRKNTSTVHATRDV